MRVLEYVLAASQSYPPNVVAAGELPDEIRPVRPGDDDADDDVVEVCVEMVAPEDPGPYRVYFRLVRRGTLDGFGERLWADFVVAPRSPTM